VSERIGVALTCLLVSACGYWTAHPTANTAPSAWAASPASAEPADPGRRREPSIVERLANLEALERTGVIGPAEYRERRQAILDDGFDASAH
jgi:hypothetical protein